MKVRQQTLSTFVLACHYYALRTMRGGMTLRRASQELAQRWNIDPEIAEETISELRRSIRES